MSFPFRSHRYDNSSSGIGYVPHYPRSLNLDLPILNPESVLEPVFYQPYYLPPNVLLDMLNTKRFQIEARFAPSELSGLGPISEASGRTVNDTINNGSVWYDRDGELQKINEGGFLSLSDVYENYLPAEQFDLYPDALAQWPCGINYRYDEVIEEDDTDFFVSVSFFIRPPTSMGQAVTLGGEHFWFHQGIGGITASISSEFSPLLSFSSGHFEINGEQMGVVAPGFPIVKITSAEYF
jgi:hypothetical protein